MCGDLEEEGEGEEGEDLPWLREAADGGPAGPGMEPSLEVPSQSVGCPPLNLHALRQAFPPKQLQLFANLCCGLDFSRVRRSADHAKTVSVEDSFWTCPIATTQALSSSLCALAAALLRKLRAEEAALGAALRPRSFRLTVRFKVDAAPADGSHSAGAKRTGRQVQINWQTLKPKGPPKVAFSGDNVMGRKAASSEEPLDLLDKQKASALVEIAEQLFHQLWPTDRPFHLHIVNLALGTFEERRIEKGTQGIECFFRRQQPSCDQNPHGEHSGQGSRTDAPDHQRSLPVSLEVGIDGNAFFDDVGSVFDEPQLQCATPCAEEGTGLGGTPTAPNQAVCCKADQHLNEAALVSAAHPSFPSNPAGAVTQHTQPPTTTTLCPSTAALISSCPIDAPLPVHLQPSHWADIDPAVLAQLPPDIQQELLAGCGRQASPGRKRKRSASRNTANTGLAGQKTIRSMFGPSK